MKKWMFFLLMFSTAVVSAQFFQYIDTTYEFTEQKNTNYATQRSFSENLEEKYQGEDFTYREEQSTLRKQAPSSPVLTFLVQLFANFMQYIFPFLLGGFIIFLVLKSVLGSDFTWFSLRKKKDKQKEKQIYEEEVDIKNQNLEELLQNAINLEDFRLAVRFYFLIILKELSKQKLIDYHKDKTNTEYLFELKSNALQQQFSYLLYLYNYIWYGEFAITKSEFYLAETKYQSFQKALQ